MTISKEITSKKYQKTCVQCGIQFYSPFNRTKYCSIHCRAISWYHKQSKSYKKSQSKHNAIMQRNRKRQRKLKAIEMLGGKCSICGYNKCAASLDFHHLDKSIKDKDIKEMMHLSWKRIEKEISKCILLCANCHRELHYKEINGKET